MLGSFHPQEIRLLIWPLTWPYWPMASRVAFEGGWAWNILRFYFPDGRSVWPYFFGGWLRKKLEIAKLSEVIWQAGTWTWTHEWRSCSYSTYPYHPCILVWITYIYSSLNSLHPPQIINQILVNIPYTDAMGQGISSQPLGNTGGFSPRNFPLSLLKASSRTPTRIPWSCVEGWDSPI